jgi:YfiR/HmsC-like
VQKSFRHPFWRGLTVSLTIACGTTSAQTASAPALKAAFLFNFAKFAEWPLASRSGPLTICVLGDPAVADALERTVNEQTIGGRRVTLSRVTVEALRACHLLYLSGLDPQRIRAMVDELRASPVMTVSDADGFAESGGVIGLFPEAGRMRFAINTDAAQRAGLRISSRVLSLAKIVKDR